MVLFRTYANAYVQRRGDINIQRRGRYIMRSVGSNRDYCSMLVERRSIKGEILLRVVNGITPIGYMFDLDTRCYCRNDYNAFCCCGYRNLNFAQIPNPLASIYWCYPHYFCTEIAMVLFQMGLPLYVILWILDWLPNMACWNEHAKVETLQGVKDSMLRLIESRSEVKKLKSC